MVPKLLFSGGGGGSNWRTLVAEGVRRILTLGLESLSFREAMGLRIISLARCAALAKGESDAELAVEGPAAAEDKGSAGTFSMFWSLSLLSASLLERKRRIFGGGSEVVLIRYNPSGTGTGTGTGAAEKIQV